jgi:hypothetical protein
MISDLELAQACQAAYHKPPSIPVPPTGTDVRITLASDNQTWIVANRGSVSAEDWARDFFFAPALDREHPQLGRCHAGMLDGAESVASIIASAVGDSPFILTGHSLGGGLALGEAGLLACLGKPPIAVVTFAAPRFGMAQFVKVMLPIVVRQYRRGNDLVPLIPAYMPPLLGFADTRAPLIRIGHPQADPFACHAIDGYVADVADYLRAAA